MEVEIERKIEETVKDILRNANMDEMTEFKLRVAVSSRLSLDLSGVEQKKFIRGVLEAFLLSMADETTDGEVPPAETVAGKVTVQREQEAVTVKKKVGGGESGDDGRVICKLSDKKNVAIHVNRGKTLLSIGECYQNNGIQVPASRGINLTNEQWSVIKKNIPAIEETIGKLQSKSRSQPRVENDGDVSNSVTGSTYGFLPFEISRFDGTNYLCWASQMELFLKQLNLAYVLVQPCPSTSLGRETNPEELYHAKSAEQKWVNDDYLCRYHIWSSLSDHLYYHYSKKSKNAKELWDELKWVYLYQESGSRRSQVRKYIEFKMVEEKPILEQVQEFNKIADSIVTSGMVLDENFHSSVILSKLPPSWKSFCIKMLQEEYLPIWMLLEHVKAEEELKNTGTQRVLSNFTRLHVDGKNLGTRTRDVGRQNIGWKRKEPERDGRPVIVCHNCGRKGHLTKNCWGKKSDKGSNEKHTRNNSSTSATPVATEANTCEQNVI